MIKQISTLSNTRKLFAFFLLVVILSVMLASCAGLAKGAGCQNGFGGYGEKTVMIKGPHR